MNKEIQKVIDELVLKNLSLDSRLPNYAFEVSKNRNKIELIEKIPVKKQNFKLNKIHIEKLEKETFGTNKFIDLFKNEEFKLHNKFALFNAFELDYIINYLNENSFLKIYSLNALDLVHEQDHLKINKLTQVMIDSGVVNPIVLVKNFESLNDLEKQYLIKVIENAEKTKKFDNYLSFDLDISQIKFILVLDKMDKNIDYEKYKVVHFSTIKRSEMIKIVNSRINHNYFSNNKEIELFLSYLINENNIKFIKEAISDLITFSKKYNNLTTSKINIIHLWSKESEFTIKTLVDNESKSVGQVNVIGVNSIGKGMINNFIVRKTKNSENNHFIKTEDKDFAFSIGLSLEFAKLVLEENNIVFDDCKFITAFDQMLIEAGGNSIGLTATTAFISSLLNIPISNKVAFSGAISLNGKIKPVGGIEQKLMACSDLKINKVYISKQNEKQYLNIKDQLNDSLDVVLVETYQKVFEEIFLNNANNKNILNLKM